MTVTATPTRDERTVARLAELTAARAARLDELDLPRTLTPREVSTYLVETATLDQKIAQIQKAAARVAELGSAEDDTRWLDDLNRWRDVLSAELGTIKSPMREQAVQERAARLTWSIRLIDYGLGISKIGPIVTLATARVGELMAAAGYEVDDPGLHGPRGWRGHRSEVEKRVKALAAERASADAALDETLLSDAERAARDAEAKQLRDAFNGLIVKNRADGDGLIVLDEDGNPRHVKTLSDVELRAFLAADAREHAYREGVRARQAGRTS